MFKSSPGYKLGWSVIKSAEKPFGLHRNWSHDHPFLYPGKLFKISVYFLKYISSVYFKLHKKIFVMSFFFFDMLWNFMHLRRHTLFLICLRLIINFILSFIIIYTINQINQTLICQLKKLIYLPLLHSSQRTLLSTSFHMYLSCLKLHQNNPQKKDSYRSHSSSTRQYSED